MQTIVTIGIFQAIVALLLFMASRRKRQGELLLVSGLFFCMMHLLVRSLLLNVYGYANKGFEVSTFMQTTYSLLYFLYVRKLAKKPLFPLADAIVFYSFFIISLANYLFAIVKGTGGAPVDFLLGYNYLNNWLFVLSGSYFLIRTFWELKYVSNYWKEEKALMRQFSFVSIGVNIYFLSVILANSFPINGLGLLHTFAQLRWINYSVLLYTALALVWYKIKLADTEKAVEGTLAAALESVSPITNPPVFIPIRENGNPTDNSLEEQNQTGNSPNPSPATLISEAEKTLGFESIIATLESMMSGQRLYKDEGLTIEKLATVSNIYKHQISMALNQHAGKPFQLFVNEFRVQEVITELQRCAAQRISPNMLLLAFEAGFNSKSSFNLNFKKITGHSPTSYFNALIQNEKTGGVVLDLARG